MKIRFGQARERKQLQWRESFNVFSGVGFRCGSKRGKKEHGLNGVTHVWLHLVQKVMGFVNAFLYGYSQIGIPKIKR